MSRLHTNHKVMLRIIIIGVLVSLLLTPMMLIHAQGDALVPNLDIVLVIDESGSMYPAPRGSDNDPGVPGVHNGWRFVMADMFIQNWLGIDQSGAQHRVGVVMFGSEAVSVQGGLTPVTEGARLSSQIDMLHQDMNGTDYVAALNAAKNMLSDSRPDAKKAIIFLSDGWCADEKMNEEQCTSQVFQMLPSIDVPIYTIAFASDSFSQNVNFRLYKNLLEAMAADTGGRYFNPAKNEQELFNVYETILRDLLALPPGDPPEVVTVQPGGTDVPFEIEPNVYQVWVTVFKKDANILVDLFRPGNMEVPCNNNDAAIRCNSIANSVSYSIRAPESGSWRVHLSGEGWAQIRKIKFVSNLTAVNKPFQNPWPAGKPLEISWQVVDKTQTPIDLEGMEVSLVKPDGSEVTLQPVKDSQLYYTIQYPDTAAEGDYKILVNRPNKGDDITLQHAITVTVKKLPWLQVVLPQAGGEYPVNLPLDISAQLTFGANSTFVAPPNDNVNVHATIWDTNTNQVGDLDLLQGDQGIYNGQLTLPAQGNYTVDVRLQYTSADGESLTDVSQVTFKIGPEVTPPIPTITMTVVLTPSMTFTPTPTPTPTKTLVPPSPPPDCTLNPKAVGCDKTPLILGIIGLLVAGGAGVGGFLWYRGLPALKGSLDIANGVLTPLSGKRPMYIGSDPKSQIFLSGSGVLPRHAVLKPTGTGVELTALDPSNPVKVNGYETSYQLLQDGDKIQIGDQEFTYTAPPDFTSDTPTIDPGDSSGPYSF